MHHFMQQKHQYCLNQHSYKQLRILRSDPNSMEIKILNTPLLLHENTPEVKHCQY